MKALRIYRQRTPIERYLVNGRPIFVKRDDLFGRPPAPPLGKLRGMRAVLRDMHRNGIGSSDAGTREFRGWEKVLPRHIENLLECARSYRTRLFGELSLHRPLWPWNVSEPRSSPYGVIISVSATAKPVAT